MGFRVPSSYTKESRNHIKISILFTRTSNLARVGELLTSRETPSDYVLVGSSYM